MKDGRCSERLYNVWRGMKQRCYVKGCNSYKHYGARGIKMCDEWKDYCTFKSWALQNGYEEDSNLSLDRIDFNGNYCPENCRFTTQYIQNINQRKRKDNTSKYKGVTYSKQRKVWLARISLGTKRIYVGRAKSAKQAYEQKIKYIIENNLQQYKGELNEYKG